MNPEDIKTENTITPEQLEEVKKAIKESETEQDKLVASLPSNNGVEESDGAGEPVTESATVRVNPLRGDISVANSREESESELEYDPELVRLLNADDDEIYKIPDSLQEIEVSDEMISKAAEASGLTNEDIINIMPLLKAVIANEERDWYNELPENIQKLINTECGKVYNTSKEAKNLFASELLGNIVRDAKMDKIVIDMQKSVQEAFNMDPLMEMVVDREGTIFEKKIGMTIDSINKKIDSGDISEEEITLLKEKRDNLASIRDSYIESYKMDKLYEAVKNHKIRVKPFDVKKYKRYCGEFIWKYKKDTPFIIHDPSGMGPIIYRHFNREYKSNQIVAFIIAFIKFTANMKANDTADHTYMSYFISNILNLDLISKTSGQSAFITLLMSNIDKVLRAVNNLPEREYVVHSDIEE